MISGPDDKILRDEALKNVRKSDILHSSGFVSSDGLATGGARMTYEQRKEMQRQYVKKYDDSQLGQNRNPFARARAVQPAQDGQKRSRFDALIRRRPR